MIFFRKKKNKKIKKPLTSQEKEKRFIKIGTRVCLVLAISFAIIFGISDAVGSFKEATSNDISEELTKLISGVNRSELIYEEIDNDYFDGMMVKIADSQLDIIDNDKPNHEKYSQDNISLAEDISFTNQEIALLYSYVFMFSPDAYDVIFQQLIITTFDNGYSIDIVSTIDFYTLFTSKVSNEYNSKTLSSFPKKIFITNSMIVEDGVAEYSPVKYNNLNEEESSTITKLIEPVNNNIDLDKYAINLLNDFTSTLAEKTDSTISYIDNCIKFSKNI